MYTASDARMDSLLSNTDVDKRSKLMTMVKIYEEKIQSAAAHGEYELTISKEEFERDFENDKGLISGVLLALSYRGFYVFEPSLASTEYEFEW